VSEGGAAVIRNPKAMMAALAGGLIAQVIGYGYYKFVGSGDLAFMRWATEDRYSLAWLMAGIAFGYMSLVKFGPSGPSHD
jgi:hypothetical protein